MIVKKNFILRIEKKLITIMIITLMMIPSLFQYQESFQTLNDTDDLFIDLNSSGTQEWWNSSFKYRLLINITNPYNIDFTDYPVSIEFNYTNIVNEGKMNSSLKDLRIVEYDNDGIGYLREYYFQTNYSQKDFVSVWFKTNISAGPNNLEQDVYLYYGNNSVNYDENYYKSEISSCVSWWGFEEGSGDNAEDLMELNNGTLHYMDNSNWVSGKFGEHALYFDGIEEYIEILDDDSLDMTEEISISLWFKWAIDPDNGDDWATLIDKDKESNGWGIQHSGPNPSGSPYHNSQVEIKYGGRYVFSEITEGIQKDTWYHIVSTFKDISAGDNEFKIYIDGSENVHRDISRSVQATTRNVYIGKDRYSSRYFNGIIDDVRIYDYALIEDEIEWLYINYTLDTVLNSEEVKNATIRVNAIDLYGNFIPTANISIYEASQPQFPCQSKLANSQGIVEFTDLDVGEYNFTATITSFEGAHVSIVNISELIPLQGLFKEIDLICNVSTNFFNVIDVDGISVDSGWILVGNTTDILQNCTLNSMGQARFWWEKTTPYAYNFTMYYRDDNYNPKKIILAQDDITNPNSSINLQVNLTTIDFTIYSETGGDLVSGVKLILKKNNINGASIVNLTTNDYGQATLRWFNSSGISANYSLEMQFFGSKSFNTTSGWEDNINFTVSSKADISFRIKISIENFQTELISLNPLENIELKWGSVLKLRCLFNISKSSNPDDLGPTYADSMIYKVKYGGVEVLDGTMVREIDYNGIHSECINTSLLNSGENYGIEILAEKSGFLLPLSLNLQLSVAKNDIILNQSENNDSEQSIYWQESTNMSVNAYGENSESLIIEDEIYKTIGSNEYYFDFSIPNISHDWNLSRIIFDIYNVTFNVNEPQININITDPFGFKHTWTMNNATYYYPLSQPSSNGTWSTLVIDLNKGSITKDNLFDFVISGTFDNTIDIVARVFFLRDKVNIEYSKFNITNSINIYSDGNGWVMKNITFEISNCFNISSWTKITPEDANLNITFGEGLSYSFISTGLGTGYLTISDVFIYPLSNNRFQFYIENSTNIIFDAIIKVSFIQDFYRNSYLESINFFQIEHNFINGGTFQINVNDKDFEWDNQGATLSVIGINNGSNYFIPSEVGMIITIEGHIFVFDDYGVLILNDWSGFNLGTIYSSIIRTTCAVNFTLSYYISYSRKVNYEVKGAVTYQIREAPDIYGNIQYNENANCYLLTINSTLLDADDYTFRFTISKEHYQIAIKDLNIVILNRLTRINGSISIYENIVLSVGLSKIFSFNYSDAFTGIGITECSIAQCEWENKDINGTIIGSGITQLNDIGSGIYELNFNTELLNIGTFTLVITIGESNYIERSAIIILEIIRREFKIELSDNKFNGDIISVVSGNSLQFEIKLKDATDNQLLSDTEVYLIFLGKRYNFTDNGNGTYSILISQLPDSFFTSQQFSVIIYFEKSNFIDATKTLFIVVTMTEIFPGFPMFYFLMIIGAIVAVVGSLVTYRQIQRAKIPTFVKKVRSIKKVIESRTNIPEALLFPPKEKYLVKLLGDDWKVLGLSLNDILGVNRKKSKKISNQTDQEKKLMGGDI